MLFTTATITVAVAFASQISNLILSPQSIIGYINAIVFLIGSLSVACSWGHALLALRIQDSSVLPKSRQAAEYLREIDQKAASLYIYNCYVDTLEKLGHELDEKSKDLEKSYEELVIGAYCTIFVTTVSLLMEIFQ